MVQLDAAAFHKRLSSLLSHWKSNPETFQSVDTILFVMGEQNEGKPYQKTTSLHRWLLGFEFVDTLIILKADRIVFVSSQKKAKILESLTNNQNSEVQIQIFERPKGDGGLKKALEDNKLGELIRSGDKPKIGVLRRDEYEGKFYQEWKSYYGPLSIGATEVDITSGIATVWSVKDKDELKAIRTASQISSRVLKQLNETIMGIIDKVDDNSQVKTTHEQLAAKTEEYINENWLKKLGLGEYPLDALEWCYTPIIQSGGNYNLRPSGQTDSSPLDPGTIICSLGVRYKSFCSNVSRTMMIGPTKEQERNYSILVELQEKLLASVIKEGVTCAEVYAKAKQFLESKDPSLKDHFMKDCGFGIGIEFRESAYMLSPACNKEIKAGMVFNLILGLQNLENPGATDPRKKTYALLISDVVMVQKAGTTPGAILLTDVKKRKLDVCFELDSKAKEVKSPVKPVQKKTAVLASKLRGEENNDVSAEQKRKIHQKELLAQKNREGLAKYAQAGDVGQTKAVATFKRFESYKKESEIPSSVRDLKIHIDKRTESVILPVFGQAVPFHISTIKNVVKSDDQDHMDLRFNFITPGQAGKKEPNQVFENPNAKFIKMLTFRSTDKETYASLHDSIKQLQASIKKREKDRQELADIVEQARLVETRKPAVLPYVMLRSHDAKKNSGDVEIHTNGIKFRSNGRKEIDVLFSNMQHMIFQPCDMEMIVLIHLHLRNPIIIGEKKIKDLQFYREVGEAFDETGSRKRRFNYGDEDELAAEEEERKRKISLNTEFKNFAKKIEAESKGLVSFDEPIPDLGFNGVPNKSQVFIQPTRQDCLVNLSELPFLCITMADVELVHLERVQFGLKNFDMVLIYKDFKRTPSHINIIPMEKLEVVKDWLDEIDIATTEGPQSLAWNSIMKTINDDPLGFFQNDAWSFLQMESEDEDASESASEYEGSEDEYSSEDDSGSGSGSDFSGSGSGSDASSDEGSEEESEQEESERPMKRKGGETNGNSKKKPKKPISEYLDEISDAIGKATNTTPITVKAALVSIITAVIVLGGVLLLPDVQAEEKKKKN
ncbi:FACT complex subunit spt16 [Nowakowskiella sp. JEL0407]|nr:FACT complex subunit spt16 [Nowakowskiella sp. JEL0407]